MKELTVKGYMLYVFSPLGNLIQVTQGPSNNIIAVFNKNNLSSFIHYKKEHTIVLKVDNSLKITFTDIQENFFQHLINLLK